MKSILCFELKRCFGSKRLYLSLLTGIVISLLHIIFGVLPLTQWLSSWQGDFFLTPHSAYGHWIGMDSSTVWPTLLYMLLPFLCAFPFSDTVSWDFNTGYVMQIFVRRKKSTYLFAKALTIFIASAFLTATILFFDFAGTALYLPLVRPEALTNLYGISNRSLMAHLFYHKPLQYTVIYIIMDALLVGAWEIIALAVSVATRNPLQPALFPLLVLSFAIGLRITRLNGSYLATEDCYGYPQKPIEWNGLKIELIGAEIVDGEAFLQEYNIDRESIFSDSLSEKYALFHISVTKVSDSPLLTYYRFDYCGAEKDGWRNLVSPEIFESLNPLAKKPSQLSVGETEELAMAIGLHKDAFRNTEWSNLSTSDISLVMSVYPQKVILQSS